MSKNYIILDRDGVINYDSAEFIKTPDEWIPIPGSLEAIAQLTQAGWQIFIATNQSGIARRLFNVNDLHDIHAKMLDAITEAGGKINAVVICPHGPDDHCKCRKPQPGLLLQLATMYDLPLKQTYLVGDAWRDLQAALAVGAKPILVKTGKGESTLKEHICQLKNIPIYASLADVVADLLVKGKP